MQVMIGIKLIVDWCHFFKSLKLLPIPVGIPSLPAFAPMRPILLFGQHTAHMQYRIEPVLQALIISHAEYQTASQLT